MGTSGLEEVNLLNFAHEGQVLLENDVDGGSQIVRAEDLKLEETQQEDHKVKFVACSVVDSQVRAETLDQVSFELSRSLIEARSSRHLLEIFFSVLDNSVQKYLESFVSEPHGLLDRRDFIYPLAQFVKISGDGFGVLKMYYLTYKLTSVGSHSVILVF
jgi:hypothetical protein